MLSEDYRTGIGSKLVRDHRGNSSVKASWRPTRLRKLQTDGLAYQNVVRRITETGNELARKLYQCCMPNRCCYVLIYRNYVIKSRTQIRAKHVIFHKILNYLLSKIEPHLNECLTQRLQKIIRAAALNNVFTVCKIYVKSLIEYSCEMALPQDFSGAIYFVRGYLIELVCIEQSIEFGFTEKSSPKALVSI